MKYKIITYNSFENELDEIIYYIAHFLNEPKIAQKMHYNIIKKILSLEQFPEGYPKLHYNNPNVRKLYVKNYIIIYEIHKNERRGSYFTYNSFKSKLSK